jgi:hypothetical protein
MHLQEVEVPMPSRWGFPCTAYVARSASLLLFAALALAMPTQGAEADEYQAKGEFLLSFARFVEWPAESQIGMNDEVRVCVLGSGQVTAILSKVLQGQNVGRQDVMVRRVEDLAGAAWCRIFFVTKSSEMEPEFVLNSLGAASILTVGETKGFAANGGMVNFIGKKGKVRFEINQGAAHRAGLKISSKLLRLAELVED